MGIISVEQMSELYWLGRYSERVYTTLKLYEAGFDEMIEEHREQAYAQFCENLEIPDVYGSKETFLKKYPYDETDPNSILSNLNRAYDNAIIMRELIGSETLSYIQLAIYDMQKAKISPSPIVALMGVVDNILAFWGVADDSMDSERARNLIKTGKRIERIDLYGRLHIEKKELLRELHRLIPRIAKSGISYNQIQLKKLENLIQAEELDYHQIVKTAESIVEE